MTTEQQQRVLIVDDNSDVRLLLVTALRQKSLIVDEAASGREAIEKLRTALYSVILLDLMMPDIDGFGVLEAIHGGLSAQPIVLVVTGASRQLIDQLDSARIHGVVRKPFDPIEVASLVASCVDASNRGPFETMAMATVLSSAALMGWLTR